VFSLESALDAQTVAQWSDLPYPAEGSTALRHRGLAAIGQHDLSLARIAEAHTDALAILHEAGGDAAAEGLYGVWASDGANSQLTATKTSDGEYRLDGVKQYCSGSTLVARALVTAHADEGLLLFDIGLQDPGVRLEPSTWKNTAFADTATRPVVFSQVQVKGERRIGDAGWYLSRPGFWHGALGPAACWAGGALYLIEAATSLKRKDSHAKAHAGALAAIGWNLQGILQQAGQEIDADPADADGAGRRRALMARHLIERHATEVLDRFGRLSGPQLLAFNEQSARQYAALSLYIRQCHAERDLEEIVS
jgi:alkylation response protein AidB-like acyl-CoA dehydrogenase